MSLEAVHNKENVWQLYMRQFNKWTDLNLLAEGSSKVAMDGLEPAILRWQAGMHPQDHKLGHEAVCYLLKYIQ